MLNKNVDNSKKMFNKSFSWSYSRLKGYEDCARRYHELMVLKRFVETRTEHLDWGDAVHDALADSLRSGRPLAGEYAPFQQWLDKLNRTAGKLYVEAECKWAINRQLRPTEYFAPDVWLRGQADAVKVDPPAALVVDWKTGKSNNADELQLILMALLTLIHFPKVARVRADFVWLKENTSTTLVVDCTEIADHWAQIIPRARRLEEAHAVQDFPPTPNRFCRAWCPVSSCEFHGK